MSSRIDSREGSRFQNDVLPSQTESISDSDLHVSNSMNLPDSLPSLLMVSSQESSDSNEATMESTTAAPSEPVVPFCEGDAEASTVPLPQREAPPQRFPRMIVDVDAYMDDDDEEEGDESDPVNEKEDLYAKTVLISNRVNNNEDPYGQTVVISNVTHSSSVLSDEEVPSPMASPKRSSSQKAAVRAVLGYDVDEDYDLYYEKTQLSKGLADQTAELTDDELAAVIPPSLRRHASRVNATPGAYLVHGSGLVSLAPTASMTCDTTDVEDVPMGAPPTLIAATLVDPMASYSSMDGVGNYHKSTLVFAEPLWWKRRFVLCLSGWMLLALGVITLSVTLAFLLAENKQSDMDTDPTSNASTSIPSAPTWTNVEVSSTSAPTVSPVIFVTPTVSPVTLAPQTYAPGSVAAFHAASWGSVSTCEEENSPFFSNELFIYCGGDLEIHNKSEGVVCEKTSAPDGTSRTATCRWNQTAEASNDVLGVSTTQATGLILFSCRGSLEQEQAATAELPETPVTSNCSATSDPLASNFLSVGRFCFENENRNWTFRHALYKCEDGEDQFTRISDRKSRRLTFLDDLFAGLLGLKDLVRYGIEFLNITSFCYNIPNCTDAIQENCMVPRTVMSDRDDSCVVSGEDVSPLPTIDFLWEIAQLTLEPSTRIDALVEGPVPFDEAIFP